MVEYERKFNQLSRYTLYLVNTKEKKAWYFEKGLRRKIAGILAGLELPTYAELASVHKLFPLVWVWRPVRQNNPIIRESGTTRELVKTLTKIRNDNLLHKLRPQGIALHVKPVASSIWESVC